MTRRELPMKSREHDALTRWRPGMCTWVKRKYNKRVRSVAKQQVKIWEDCGSAKSRLNILGQMLCPSQTYMRAKMYRGGSNFLQTDPASIEEPR